VGADTHWTLYTGGKAAISLQNLFSINANGQANGGSLTGLFGGGFWHDAPINGVVAEAIQVLGQALGNDGLLWTVQPFNAAVDLNLQIPSKKHTSANIWAADYKPTVLANGVTLDPSTVTPGADFCVGQGITFDVGNLPDQIFLHHYDLVAKWSLPDLFVNTNSDPNCDLFYEENPAFLGLVLSRDKKVSTFCWYVKGQQAAKAKVDMLFYSNNGNQPVYFSAEGKFNVHRPTTAEGQPYQPDGSPTARILGGSLSLGVTGVTNDMSFKHTITTDSFSAGQAGYVQLITSADIVTDPLPAPPNGIALDAALGEFPRGTPNVPANTNTSIWFCDAPSVPLPTNSVAFATEDVSFSTYLMFRPSGGIWVPLRLIRWELNDSATHNADQTWTATGSANIINGGDGDSFIFPHWTTTY